MNTDLIAAARALIEPLTGYTPKPWTVDMSYQWPSKVRAAPPFNDRWICDASSGLPHTLSNARLIAAAPDLRDMVATLADALEAERDQALARAAAAAMEMREGAADCVAALYGKEIISALPIDPDAEAALQRVVDAARLEGWRAGREAAADEAHSCTHDPYVVRAIRAIPEPKEASHD